jgi:hypothetical protein
VAAAAAAGFKALAQALRRFVAQPVGRAQAVQHLHAQAASTSRISA